MSNIIETEIRKRSLYPNGKPKNKKKKKTNAKPYDAHKGKSFDYGKNLTRILGGYNDD